MNYLQIVFNPGLVYVCVCMCTSACVLLLVLRNREGGIWGRWAQPKARVSVSQAWPACWVYVWVREAFDVLRPCRCVWMGVSVALPPPLQALNDGILNMHTFKGRLAHRAWGLTRANRCLTTITSCCKVTAKQPTDVSLCLWSLPRSSGSVCQPVESPVKTQAPVTKHWNLSTLLILEGKQLWEGAYLIPKTTASFIAALTEEPDDIWTSAKWSQIRGIRVTGGMSQQAVTSMLALAQCKQAGAIMAWSWEACC